jgi:hypothetical protein
MKRPLSIALIVATAVISSGQFKRFGDVPAYNAAPPAKGQKVPAILTDADLDKQGFKHPAQKASYKAAAKVSDVVYQLPCYCYCDRSFGHNSLHSCFESDHGARCAMCMKEAIFAEKATREGKTAKQIRDLINQGAQDSVDLEHAKPSDIPDKATAKAVAHRSSKKS